MKALIVLLSVVICPLHLHANEASQSDAGVEELLSDSEAARKIAVQKQAEAEKAKVDTQKMREQRAQVMVDARAKRKEARRVIANAEAQIAKLKKERDQLHSVIVAKNKDIEVANAQIADAKIRVDSFTNEARILQKMRDEDQAAVDKLAKERADLSAQEKALHAQLQQAQLKFDNSVVTTNLDKAQIQGDIQALKDKLNANRAKMDQLSAQGKDLDKQIAQAKISRDVAKKEVALSNKNVVKSQKLIDEKQKVLTKASADDHPTE